MWRFNRIYLLKHLKCPHFNKKNSICCIQLFWWGYIFNAFKFATSGVDEFTPHRQNKPAGTKFNMGGNSEIYAYEFSRRRRN